MHLLGAVIVVAVMGVAPAPPTGADAIAEARRLYNRGQYDEAAVYATQALGVAATMEDARLVLGRIHLERYRRTADQADLTEAREALKAVNAEALGVQERAELTVGLGGCLFYEGRFGIASETFGRALDSMPALDSAARERVLDWWATALDRLALARAPLDRPSVYARVVSRMEDELARDPSSASAAYWLAAALRGTGDLERAWHAAAAGWIAAPLGRDRGAALRADLDRLVLQAIIPERAARLQPKDPKAASADIIAEWERLKASWSR